MILLIGSFESYSDGGLVMDSKNELFSLPQGSPDDVSDEMEGLTVTSKYKRVWVNYFLSA